MTLFSLAGRNVWRRRRRYLPALVNLLAFGAVFTLLAGVGDAALHNLLSRATVYYGGQGTLLTYRLENGQWDDTARTPAEVKALLADLPWVKAVAARHVFREPGTEALADGRSAPLRLVVGTDPEPALADDLDLAEGRAVAHPDEILLPQAVAARLNLHPGDSLTLSLRTYPGQRNTARLKVAGVYRDDPVFGRGVAYVDREALNHWSAKPAGWASENPLTTDGALTEARRAEVQAHLAKAMDLWAHPNDKKVFLVKYLTETWQGPKSVVFNLDDHTKDLSLAVAALRGALDAVALLLLLVAALGLGSTLRVLLHERTLELGTLRALGMTEERTFGLILIEVELVAILAVGLGTVLGHLCLLALSEMVLDQSFMIDPLLKDNSLGYHTTILPALLAGLFALVTVYFVARPLVARHAMGPPARALGGGE